MNHSNWPHMTDTIWLKLRQEAEKAAAEEPVLTELITQSILSCNSLEQSLAHRISRKLGQHAVSEPYWEELFFDIMGQYPEIGTSARRDIEAINMRDPASRGYLSPFLYFKGFQALTAHRISHQLWLLGRESLALYLQSLISEVFAVDIHPAARLGSGILFDHATSIVIGETAVVEDNVSILHEVTLGGTGKQRGDRHPKVRHGVLIGAGAKILGNVEVGACSKIGAGSVVLEDVPPSVTVAGVPAKIVGSAGDSPAECMEHHI